MKIGFFKRAVLQIQIQQERNKLTTYLIILIRK